MNERIKALGLQASALALEEYRTHMKTEFAGDVIYSDIYDRKFAELIVKEYKLGLLFGIQASK